MVSNLELTFFKAMILFIFAEIICHVRIGYHRCYKGYNYQASFY